MSRVREVVSELMAGRAPGRFTRAPMERIQRIHEMVKSGSLPTCTTLARALEVTPKTIQRDIDFMRDRLRMPMEYDPASHGWRYSSAVEDFPAFEVGAEELAALFLARTALESIRGTKLAEELRGIFAKLTRGIGGTVEIRWTDMDEAFSRKSAEVNGRDVKLFGQLAEAVLDQCEVVFFYRKLSADEAERRRVRPYHLGEVDGGFYLIGLDLDRGALRTFALPRISRLRVTKQKFERPVDFDGRAHLAKSFGVWNKAGDDTRCLVRVVLKDYAARLAQERRWHPTQEVRVLDAKGRKVEVCFEAGALEEVVRWVLSFGSKAEVLGPPELKALVRQELRLMKG